MKKRTLKWYRDQTRAGQVGIFDTFANEAGRNTALMAEIRSVTARANELLRFLRRSKKWRSASTPLKAECEVLSS